MNFLSAELNVLVTWMEGREAIRVSRAAGKFRPWTTDPLLRDYRWCNVRRIDDRVSQWLLKNWYVGEFTPQEDLAAATFARLVNWPGSLAEVLARAPNWLSNSYAFKTATDALSGMMQRGEKVFTGAYIVPGVPGMTKVESVLQTVAVVRDADGLFNKLSMRRTWGNLCTLDGLGSFLAGQIVADVAQLPNGKGWSDKSTWAPLGPGSTRGLNRLIGRPVNDGIRQEQFDDALPHVRQALCHYLPPSFMERLEAMDIQNCLCEFDKYRRLQMGEGTVRARYDGKADTRGTLL